MISGGKLGNRHKMKMRVKKHKSTKLKGSKQLSIFLISSKSGEYV